MSTELTPAAQALLSNVSANAQELYAKRLDPLAERLLFRLPAPAGDRQRHPMVLVLGNHSSGKSTLINYLLGREVQKTGVAPTDDGFTILAAGPVDEERDGATLAGTPGLGLGDLERFGPSLLSHVSMKIRAGAPILEHLWLVDSPGMIDASSSAIDRGYDFFGVTRWFAEAADVILLLFDPEKPGTTGETLTALTSSLAGLEHKLLIVLNKADEFQHVQDYARAYGALCWNLAKVIPRKDLPRIFNCFIPGPGRPVSNMMPVADFERSRNEIVHEIQRAPERRIDNVVTRLNQDARELLVDARVSQEVRSQVSGVLWTWRLRAVLLALIAIAPAAVTGYLSSAMLSFHAAKLALWCGAFVLLALLAAAIGQKAAERRGRRLLADLTPVFEHLYSRFLGVEDAGDLRHLWQRVRQRVTDSLNTLGAMNIPRVTTREMRGLEEIVQKRAPELRAGLHGRGTAIGETRTRRALPENDEAPAEADAALFV